jgi:hypothetical protein
MKGLTRFLCVSMACGMLGASALAAAGAEAEEEDVPGDTIIANIWAPEEKCSADMAVDARFADVASHPERFADQCVRISGLWYGRALFSDLDAYHRVVSMVGTLPNALADSRIGVYGKDEVMNRGEKPAFATVLGRVGRCEQWRGQMVMGYCHYTDGPYIALASVEKMRPARLIRQTGEAARRRLGNLEPLSGQWPRRAEVEALAVRWMDDIRKGDIADFADIHEIERDEIDLDEEDSLFYTVFNSSTSPFATFRGRQSSPEPAFFRIVERGSDGGDAPPEDAYETVACFCREARCEGRWPISKPDSDNHANRPYACLLVFSDSDRRSGTISASVRTELDYRSLEEPRPAKLRQ